MKQRLIVEQCGYTNRLPSLSRTAASILCNQNDLKNKAMLQGCSRAEHVTSTILCSVNWARNNVWGDSHRYLQTVLCHREQGGDLGAVSIGGCHCSSSSTSPAIQMAAYERTCSRPLARASPPVRVLLPDPLVDESHPLRALWDT